MCSNESMWSASTIRRRSVSKFIMHKDVTHRSSEGREYNRMTNASETEQTYLKVITSLEKKLKNPKLTTDVVPKLQEQLVEIAEKYQYDERIGKERYKIYELQGLIFFYQSNDEQAIEMLDTAQDIYGGAYDYAHSLQQQIVINNPDINYIKSTDSTYKGIRGWLAFFVFTLLLGIISTLVLIFTVGYISSSDVSILNSYEPGLGDTLQSVAILENVCAILAIFPMVTTLVLLAQRKKLAKNFAVATLLYLAIYSCIDYIVVTSIMEQSNLSSYLDPGTEITDAKIFVRNIIAAGVWIPYFTSSKRVKATLIN